ncbi:MAG: 23S rRNA (uracil(1939)-C(5))-methyltransferase RlmD [Anaerolineae bacterium]|nr:23S rRNA (uracil(1939)-C(5))-methyltransferase RlmD [Anaerolineae bacterium]
MSIRLQLTGMAHGGEALGRYEGKVIFVPYALPGEEVIVEIVEDKGRYARARLLEVVQPSPDRVEPRCPHFGVCGGCQWQHVAYEAQLRFKEEILRDQLERIGGISKPPVKPSLPAHDPWFYRNNVQFHLDEEGRLGFLALRGWEVVPIEVCHIIHPFIDEVSRALDLAFPQLKRLSIRVGTRTGQKLLILEMEEDLIPAVEVDEPLSCVEFLSDGTLLTLVGDSHILEEVGRRRFRISAASFFQVNTEQLERLIEVVRGYLAPQGHETLLDAYCGVGTFGLSLAGEVGQVIGIEESDSALADARSNAQGEENVEFIGGQVEDILPELVKFDVAILDPPRQGCAREAITHLVRLAPAKIVYISCDPATLARDTKRLREGGYHLVEVQPVDMFPQTYHIEAVALLERSTS